ncbi:MAG: hypothetical protein AAGN82_12865 [Myxococcota bacterium]
MMSSWWSVNARRRATSIGVVVMAAGLFGGGITLTAACGGEDPGADGLCQPGDNIFCRCPGGDPGTKPCNADGQSFGACEPCLARPSSGPGAQTTSAGPGATTATGSGGFGAGGPSTTTSATTGGGGAGGGGSRDVALLQTCATDGDCISGLCRFNYCTIRCTKVSDCPFPQSECIAFDAANTVCMPTCDQASDCTAYTAPPSRCGFTQAIDNWDVTVCAEWADQHQLKPPGVDCLPFDHTACNLGYLGRETICTEQGVCANGCYTSPDCPSGTSCSAQGTLGTCQ